MTFYHRRQIAAIRKYILSVDDKKLCACFVTIPVLFYNHKAVRKPNEDADHRDPVIPTEGGKNMSEVTLNNEELEGVAGGAMSQYEIYNLSNYVFRRVSVPQGTLLVMQDSPGGAFLPTSYKNGEQILVNRYYSLAGYLVAFKDGVYGFVDAKYVVG